MENPRSVVRFIAFAIVALVIGVAAALWVHLHSNWDNGCNLTLVLRVETGVAPAGKGAHPAARKGGGWHSTDSRVSLRSADHAADLLGGTPG